MNSHIFAFLCALLLSQQLYCVLAIPAVNTDCPKNSAFSRCMSRCPITCANYLNQPKGCVKICTVGCACHEGHIKVDKGAYSICIKPHECTKFGFVSKQG